MYCKYYNNEYLIKYCNISSSIQRSSPPSRACFDLCEYLLSILSDKRGESNIRVRYEGLHYITLHYIITVSFDIYGQNLIEWLVFPSYHHTGLRRHRSPTNANANAANTTCYILDTTYYLLYCTIL